ncbi:MAG: PAS domain S-box protein [gamma proteobacterium symbiont of Clathrolucina costata]
MTKTMILTVLSSMPSMPPDDEHITKPRIPPVYKRSLRFKFIIWITITLVITLGGAALYVYKTQHDLLENSLRSKANAIGEFIALISPGAIYSYDISGLDRLVQKISNDVDVVFAQIRALEGHPVTTFIPDGVQPEQIEKWIRNQSKPTEAAYEQPAVPIILEYAIKDNDQVLGWVLIGLDTTRINRVTRDAVIDLILIYSLIVIFLGSVIFIIFRMQVLHPVDILTQGASRIAEGNLEKDVPIISKDELGRLAKSFNEMMDEIKIDRETLLSINTQLAKEIEQRQKASEDLKKLSMAVEQSPASVVITNLEGIIEYVNPKFSEVSGYPAQDVIGKHTRMLEGDVNDSGMLDKMWSTIKRGDIWKGESCNKRKNGSVYWESVVIAPIRDSNGHMTHYLSVKEDITDRKAFEEKLLDQATHDQLTHLPNRFLAFDRLQQLLQHAKRNSQHVAVIYIDLDNFKNINDSMASCGGSVIDKGGQANKRAVEIGRHPGTLGRR